MVNNLSKSEVWEEWVSQTVLADISATATPDPVPIVDDTGPELEMTDEYDTYRLGRGSGDYLYPNPPSTVPKRRIRHESVVRLRHNTSNDTHRDGCPLGE